MKKIERGSDHENRQCGADDDTIATDQGFEGRLDYGAIGTVTNLAARLCGEAENGQILISPRIFSKLELQIDAEVVGELSLKGFQRPVLAHNVLGTRTA